MQKIKLLLVLLLFSIPTASLIAQTDFDNFDNFGSDPGDYGLYDYTNPEHIRRKLPRVEQYHFDSGVESLRASIDRNYIGSHLVYVIRSFPNHHRALVSITKLWALSGSTARPPRGVPSQLTPIYLYERAIDFAPRDGTVRLLYGIYLLDAGHTDDAVRLFDEAGALAPDTAEINYNLGLMYLRVNEYKKADFHSSKAYEQGHPLPGLRNKMIAAGIWSE